MSHFRLRALRCTAIGECMIELRNAAPGLLAVGHAGDTFNTLYYLNALLRDSHSRCRYLTALGDDDFSAAMCAEWQALGIDTSLVQIRHGKLPGIYRVSTDQRGERSFHYWRSDSAARYLMDGIDTQQLLADLRGEDLLYLSGISLAILPDDARQSLLGILHACKRSGQMMAFDDNYRPRLWESVAAARQFVQDALQLADVALVSFADQQALFDDASPQHTARRIRALGVPEVIVRNGAEPTLVAIAGSVREYRSELIANAIDTTGAGDSFNAAYLAARLCDCEPLAAMRAASQLSARVVSVPGAILSLSQVPSLAELL